MGIACDSTTQRIALDWRPLYAITASSDLPTRGHHVDNVNVARRMSENRGVQHTSVGGDGRQQLGVPQGQPHRSGLDLALCTQIEVSDGEPWAVALQVASVVGRSRQAVVGHVQPADLEPQRWLRCERRHWRRRR